jgi:hypothetical protein
MSDYALEHCDNVCSNSEDSSGGIDKPFVWVKIPPPGFLAPETNFSAKQATFFQTLRYLSLPK